jgi:uncharacterized cupin superfamily protein
MPKLDLEAIEATNRTSYPMPFAAQMGRRYFKRLAAAAGLTDFGVSHVVLQPGGTSSQRHWHDKIDEFVVVLSGEALLVEDEGETVLRAGDCAAFPKGVANGHHLVNRSEEDCVFLAIGGNEGNCFYPNVDLQWNEAGHYSRKDGTPYASGAS